MGRQINIDLIFNANTSQARSQMQQLQTSLNSLQTLTTKNISMEGLTGELSKASNAVITLKSNLNNAFDVNTGRLDLGKFSTNLKNSNMTLKDYRKSLEILGPTGQNAFNQLTQSIINGQMPLRKTKNLLTSMMDTFGSSIKWSIAYGAIDSIRQGFQDAFQYAQDLNESLTNIGVVAQKSTEQMAKFAETANKSAKALASTTVAYSDAALIFYQQGLNDSEVKERTDATIKLANVTGQSVEETSEQLTAIWNNFDNGSKKLEYYADVMAKLGAETASSADEIAQGYEKFAAVADTVGLSYERGAAAIAAVTATTRQSADIVGTAFKTLFARIQDLELGNTLDDGTTLGSYSEALNKVGINIKTTSGELKEMDVILSEMGSTWKTLSNDEQVALAKSVAGIRQYTQLIALMNNYDYFEQLTESAENSEGTLEQQQERWAQSWEAAQNRVLASAEDIYSSLINDEFFINLNNIWADLLSGIDSLLDAMGGLRTLLPFILGLLTKAFGPTAISMIGGFVGSLKGVSGEAQNTAMSLRKAALEENALLAQGQGGQASTVAADAYKKELDFITQIEQIQRNLTSKEVEELQVLADQVKMRREYLVLLGKGADEAAANVDQQKLENKNTEVDIRVARSNAHANLQTLKEDIYSSDISDYQKTSLGNLVNQEQQNIYSAGQLQQQVDSFVDKDYKINKNGKINAAGIKDIKANLGNNEVLMSQLDTGTQDLIQNFSGDVTELEKIKQALKELQLEADAARQAEERLAEAFSAAGVEGAEEDIKNFTKSNEKLATSETKLAKGKRNLNKLNDKSKKATDAVSDAVKEQNTYMDQAVNKAKQMQKVPLGTTLTAAAGSASMLAGGLSSVYAAGESMISMFTSGEHSLGGWISAISSLAMGVGMLIPGFTGLKSAIAGSNTAIMAQNILAISKIAMDRVELEGLKDKTEEEQIQSLMETKKLSRGAAIIALGAIKAKTNNLETVSEEGLTGATMAETAAEGASIPVKIASAVATWLATAPMIVIVAVIAAVVVGIIALIAIIKALINAWNADANAAKEAAENAKQIEEQYNKTKEAYEALKKSIEDYDKAQEAIAALKQGTQEWRDAIQEANQQVLSLIETYPELAKYVSNENGRLTISEEGQQALLDTQAAKVATTYNATLDAQLEADRLANVSTQTDLIRDELDTFSDVHMWAGIISGALLSPLAGIGPLIRGALMAGSISENENAASESDKAINDLQEAYNKFADSNNGFGEGFFVDWNNQVDKIAGSNTELAEKLKENKDEVQKLIKSNYELAEREKMIYQQKVDSYLSTKGFNNYEQYGKNVQRLVSERYKNEVQSTQTDPDSYHDNRFWDWWTILDVATLGISYAISNAAGARSQHSTKKGEEDFEKYAELMGYENAKATNYDGNKITFEYSDSEDGENKELSVSYEQISKTLAENALNSQETILKYANDITGAIAELEYIGEYVNDGDTIGSAAGALGTFLKDGNLDFADPEQVAALRDNLENIDQVLANAGTNADEYANRLGLSTEEMKQKIADYVRAYGDGSEARLRIAQQEKEEIQALYEANVEALETTDDALETYADYLIETNKELENNKVLAAETAVANFKLAKNLNKLQEIFKENAEILATADKTSLDYYESLGKVKEVIEDTFGLKVSSDFIVKNLETIQAAANNDAEALNNLRSKLNNDFINGLEIEGWEKTTLTRVFEDLSAQAEGLDIGTVVSLDSTEATAALNDLLLTGKVTKEEMEALFANANYEMPQIAYATVKAPPTTTTQTITRTYTDGRDPESYTETITTENTQQMPYFVGTGVQVDETTHEVTYGTSSLKVRSAGNLNSASSALKYQNGDIESSADKNKRYKELEREKDYLHEIDEIIQNTERDLNKLSTAKDRAFGQSKLDLIDKEIAKNEEILSQYEERAKQAEELYKTERESLLSSGYGVTLDKDGNISNWNELRNKYLEKLQGMDPNDVDYETYQNYLEQMEEDFTSYEEALDEVNDAQLDVLEQQYALQDLSLEKIEYTIEFKVEMSERDRNIIDFMLQTIEDDAQAAAEKIGLETQRVSTYVGEIATAQQSISDIMDMVNERGYMTADEKDKLLELEETLIDYNAELLELENTIGELLTEAFDSWNEELDENIEKFDNLNSVLENYNNIIDLVGQRNLGVSNATMREIANTQVKNAQNAVAAAKAAKDANQAVLDQYREARAAANTQEEQEMWDEQIKSAEEALLEATENFNDSFANALELAAEAFATTVDTIVQEFESSVSGIYSSLEELSSAFDRQKEINERYLADYEKTYEISKLNRQLQDSIDKSDNVANQQALRELQSELLDMQKDGTKVSERDIQLMQKRYDLMLAEQALKDAQNAKSVVRLRRDSEGNYGYVYTADQSAVNDAQQNYEDKLYDLQQWQEESLLIIQEGIIATQQEFADAIKEISEDESLTIEEREKKIAELTEYYTGQLYYWTSEANKLTEQTTALNQQYNTTMADNFHDTIIGSMFPEQDSWSSLYTTSHQAMNNATANFVEALSGDSEYSYKNAITGTFDAAGQSVEGFEDTVKTKLPNVQTESDLTKTTITNLGTAFTSSMGEAVTATSTFYTKFSGWMSNVRNECQQTIDKITEMLKLLSVSLEDEKDDDKSGQDDSNEGPTTSESDKNIIPGQKYIIGDTVHTKGVETNQNITTYSNNNGKFSTTKSVASTISGKILDVAQGTDGKVYYKVNFQGSGKWVSGDDLYGGAYKKQEVKISTSSSQKQASFTIQDKDIIYDLGLKSTPDNNSYDINSSYNRLLNANVVGYRTLSDGSILFQINDQNNKLMGYTNLPHLYTALTADFTDKLETNYKKLSTFDTGGYTGQWGPEGRLAMLHQKEIVLNAQDTENFLSAIKIVRSMADQLEANALAARYGLTAYSATSIKPQGDTLEQNVTIHAEFPNATNHNEIEEAFRNLNNLASQYANRK